MKREQQITGIDVGSYSVRVVVAQVNSSADEDQITILGSSVEAMKGVQKGVVNDVEEAVKAVSRALDVAERISGQPIEHAHVSINGSHIMSQNSRGVIAVSRADGEITSEDVARVINAAQAISLPSNREILHVLPQNFIVDGQENIHDPVGMTGVRLEVETHIIEGSAPFIKNITKVVNQAGIHVEDFVFSPLAAAKSVIDRQQKELGVVLVDLGAGTTSIVVYEENTLLHTAVLPLGSSHITNDIAIGLRTSIEVAETIKKEHGTALVQDVKASETILVKAEEDAFTSDESISRQEVAKIIYARLEEIFTFVDKELKNINRSGLLPAGIIITGGGANLPGVIELAKKRLRLPAKIGHPQLMPGLADQTDAPDFAVVLGLILWAQEQEIQSKQRIPISIPQISHTVSKMRGWIQSLMP